MILSTPDRLSSIFPSRPLVTPPSSPSKRRQSASHYSGVESSPSKRRVSSPKKVVLDAELRIPLFGTSTYNQSIEMDNLDEVGALAADLSMQDIESPPKRRVKAMPVSKAGTRAGTFSRTSSSATVMEQDVAPKRSQGRTRRKKSDDADVFT